MKVATSIFIGVITSLEIIRYQVLGGFTIVYRFYHDHRSKQEKITVVKHWVFTKSYSS